MRLRSLLPRSLRDRLDLHRTAVLRFVREVAATVPAGAWIVDAGAGEGPFREFFAHARYVGVDDGRGDARWDYSALAVTGDLLRLPFRDGSVDGVLCTETLEHVTDPGDLLIEAARVLAPGGRLFLTAPLSFKEHQQPHDYFRYTQYGLRLLLERAGLEPERVDAEGGYFRFLGDKIQPAHRYLFRKDRAMVWKILFLPLHPFSMLFFTVFAPAVCAKLDPLDKRRIHTTGYLVVARKPGGAS
jgi:SAM-dependent methyltransferase